MHSCNKKPQPRTATPLYPSDGDQPIIMKPWYSVVQVTPPESSPTRRACFRSHPIPSRPSLDQRSISTIPGTHAPHSNHYPVPSPRPKPFSNSPTQTPCHSNAQANRFARSYAFISASSSSAVGAARPLPPLNFPPGATASGEGSISIPPLLFALLAFALATFCPAPA